MRRVAQFYQLANVHDRLHAPFGRSGRTLPSYINTDGFNITIYAKAGGGWGGRILERTTNRVVVPIPGTRNLMHLQENVDAQALFLSGSDVTRLDSIFRPGMVSGQRASPEALARLGH